MREEFIKLYKNPLLLSACQAFAKLKWHWFQHHFRRIPLHPFAHSMIETLISCDSYIEGFGDQFLKNILEISGKEMDRGHYDQLMQRMAELLIIRQCLEVKCSDPKYSIEPTAGKSKKRPDFTLNSSDLNLIVEVKAPACLELDKLRQPGGIQLLNRSADGFGLSKNSPFSLTLPRDNAIKDFLLSADAKFASFKQQDDCVTTLVIVWDDFIQEAISALTNEESGLFTPNSFAKDKDGYPHKFLNTDAVILVRHLKYFMDAAGDLPLDERKHAFDFGDKSCLPNVFIPNPASQKLAPEKIRDVFRARPLNDEFLQYSAEYKPLDFIMWTR